MYKAVEKICEQCNKSYLGAKGRKWHKDNPNYYKKKKK